MGILRRDKSGAGTEHRIRDAIASMQPLLRLGTAHVELVRFEPVEGIAVVRLEGDCPDCELNAEVLLTGIEAHLRLRVPEIRAVRTVPSPAVGRDG